MKAVDREQLQYALRGRREEIADRWYRAIARTSFVPLSSRDVRRQFLELTERALSALLNEPFELREARGIGAALVQLHYVDPDALGKTQEVLARELVADLPPTHVVALQPRLASLLAELAAGFSAQARDTILAEQEEIRSALLAASKQAGEAQRVSEARFRAIFDGAAIGIAVATLDGRIQDVNRASEALLGYSEDELRRMVVPELTHPDDTTSDWELYQDLVTGRRDHFGLEKRFRRKDGRLMWGYLTVSLVRDAEGRPQFSIGMIEDITERKQAEETVRQLNVDLERRVLERTTQLTTLNQELASEVAKRTQAEAERIQLLAQEQAARAEAEAARQRLAFLAEASSALASSLDYKTTLTSVAYLAVPYLADWCAVDVAEDGAIHRLAVAHVDLAKVELVRQLEEHYPPEPDALSGVVPVLRTGKPEFLPEVPDALVAAVQGDEHRRRMLDELRPRSRLVVPLVARERTLGTISLVLAESGRRYNRTDLALAEDLARRAAVAVDNARLYREAQQALAARDQFLSVAAHELKTPVTNLRGYTELLLRQLGKVDGPDPQRVQRALEALDRESDKLIRLVSQLLDVTRIEAGQLALARTETDVAQLIRDVAEGAQLGTNQHTIRVDAPLRVMAVVDPLRLEQVLSNLLSNAINYSPKGGRIDLELSLPDAETVRLTVRDHGVGIPVEHRHRVFERFHQVHPGASVAGMGLGLYISRQIVDLHGGRIDVELPHDGGSRFIVMLPTGLPGGQERTGV